MKSNGLSAFTYVTDDGGIILKKLRKPRLYDKRIEIPDGVIEISAECFSYSDAVALVLPRSVKRIGKNAFENCYKLKMIYIPTTVEVIDDCAFRRCEKLEIYCEGEPTEKWLQGKPQYNDAYAAMDAFNFHRSGGSFDDDPSGFSVIEKYNHFNPEARPVHTFVPLEKFVELMDSVVSEEE